MNAPRLSRRALWCLPVLAGASALILAAAPAQYVGRQQDDLLYLVAAKSLASGAGLRLITTPGSPKMTMINPLFPLLLAPLALLPVRGFALEQAFCALLLAAVPFAAWLWLRRRCEDPTAALIAAAFASSPLVLSQAGAVMSEPLFTLMTIAALAFASRPAVGGTLLLALTQTRLAGVPVAAAAALEPVAERRWRETALLAVPAAAGLLAWTAWSRSGGGLQKVDELSRAYSGTALTRLPLVALDNARFYLSALGGCALPARLAATRASLAVGLLWSAAAGLGSARLLRRRPFDPAVLALAGTAAMHLLWPWQYERYLIMPLPLLLWTAAEGLGAAAPIALSLLVSGQLAFQARPWLSGTSWRAPELAQTYSWLRGHAAPQDALASAMYLRDGFYAGTSSVPLAEGRDAAEISGKLKRLGARWVLEQDGLDIGLSLPETAPMTRRLAGAFGSLKDPRYFELAYENEQEQSRVYRVR